MKVLKEGGKENTVYHLSKSLGEKRDDGSPRLPIDRMPFGLIEYNLKFFSLDDANNIHASQDYLEWQTTMFAHFGHKWDKLHRGPMWSFDGESDDDQSTVEDQKMENGDILSQAITESFGESGFPLAKNEISNTSPPTEVEAGDEEHVQLSTLWSGLSQSRSQELGESQIHPNVIAREENIIPNRKRKRKLKTRNPMKVKKIVTYNQGSYYSASKATRFRRGEK